MIGYIIAATIGATFGWPLALITNGVIRIAQARRQADRRGMLRLDTPDARKAIDRRPW